MILKGAPSDLLPNSSHGHVVLGDPSPVLFYPISSNEVRCLVDIPASVKMPSVAKGEDIGTCWRRLCRRFRSSFDRTSCSRWSKETLDRCRTRRWRRNRRELQEPCSWATRFNIDTRSAGGGMTVALNDISTFKSMLSPLPKFSDPVETGAKLDEFYRHRTRPALTINTLANAAVRRLLLEQRLEHGRNAPGVFRVPQARWKLRARSDCALGRSRSESTQSGESLFSVALFGIGRLMVPLPTPERLLQSGNILAGACKIIFPIVKGERVRAHVLSSVASNASRNHLASARTGWRLPHHIHVLLLCYTRPHSSNGYSSGTSSKSLTRIANFSPVPRNGSLSNEHAVRTRTASNAP